MEQLKQDLLAAMGGREAFRNGFAARTMRDLDRRVDMELESAAGEAERAFAAIAKAAAAAGVDQAAENDAKNEWLGRYRRAWIAYQQAGQRVLNWMVTGPARFPVDRNRKRMDAEHKRLNELLEISKGAGAWAAKRFRRAIAAELGAGGIADRELEAARANLAQRERRQEMMKAANASIRKHRKAEPFRQAALIAADMSAAGYAEISESVAAELIKPGMVGGQGFAGFQLSNNGAEIRRLKSRIAELEAKAARIEAAAEAPPAELELGGVRVVKNSFEDRLQIFFDGKPPAEIRDKLKGRGFRWAPSVGAWQRQLTANAVAAAEAILRA